MRLFRSVTSWATLLSANRYLNAPQATNWASADNELSCLMPTTYGGKRRGFPMSVDFLIRRDLMSLQSKLPQVLRFGVFQIDIRAGELHKNGVKLKLQEQPFQVLCLLLEHPGELVSREEFRNRLWPADTFVDFDHGLNAAIKRLRDALGDSADTPVFIETLARRGYRFIAPVDGSFTPNAVGIAPASEPSKSHPRHRVRLWMF